MDKEELLNMKLHEIKKVEITLTKQVTILRVFGGWIYDGDTSIFVPEQFNVEVKNN